MPQTAEPTEAAREARVAELISPALHALGYELVRVSLQGPGRSTLQIMVERNDRAAMTVEDCAAASDTISDILDVEDPIETAFTLEVSSPGLDRPLTAPDHYRRFAGFVARVELAAPQEGRRKFSGRLGGVEQSGGGTTIVLEADDGVVRLPLDAVRKAKLVLDDDLLAAARAWAEAGRSP